MLKTNKRHNTAAAFVHVKNVRSFPAEYKLSGRNIKWSLLVAMQQLASVIKTQCTTRIIKEGFGRLRAKNTISCHKNVMNDV